MRSLSRGFLSLVTVILLAVVSLSTGPGAASASSGPDGDAREGAAPSRSAAPEVRDVKRFATKYVSHANRRDWAWIGRHSLRSQKQEVVGDTKNYRRFGRFRVQKCYPFGQYTSEPEGKLGSCSLRNREFYALDVQQRRGRLVLVHLQLED